MKMLLSLGCLSLLVATGTAFSADLPARTMAPIVPAPVPAPVHTWSGFYIGGSAGVLWNDRSRVTVAAQPGFCDVSFAGCRQPPSFSELSALTAAGSASIRSRSAAGGGGQIGYNWQFGSFVAGFEADIFAIASGKRSASFAKTIARPVGNAGVDFQSSQTTVSLDLPYLGTVKGRLGYLVTPELLAFATGGLAYSEKTLSVAVFQPGIEPGNLSDGNIVRRSMTETGYIVGGGFEYKLDAAWSVKAEYNYWDLGRARTAPTTISSILIQANNPRAGSVFSSAIVSSSAHVSGQILKVGLNYKFNSL